MPILFLFLILTVTASYAQSVEDTAFIEKKDTSVQEKLSKSELKYNNEEERLLSYLDEEKYKMLMRLSNEMVHKYSKKAVPEYCYAIGLYGLMDVTQFKKTYDTYRLQYWKMIILRLKNSRRYDLEEEKVKSSWNMLDQIQSAIYEVAQMHLKLKNDVLAMQYLGLMLDVFNERRGVFKNKFQQTIQNNIFALAKERYENGEFSKSDELFSWLDKYFYKSKFPFKFIGHADWKDSTYLFEEWTHSRYCLANTAASFNKLSQKEKQTIYLMNLMRMNPALFRHTFLKRYLERHPEMTGDAMVASLRTELDSKAQLPLFYVAEPLNEHATNKLNAFFSDTVFSAENPRFYQDMEAWEANEIRVYNFTKFDTLCPVEMLLPLLIDQGVNEMDHRITLLDPENIQLSVKIDQQDSLGIALIELSTGDAAIRKKMDELMKAHKKDASDKAAYEQEQAQEAASKQKRQERNKKYRESKMEEFNRKKRRDVHLGYGRKG